MDNILKQAPDNYTIEEIESIYNKYNQDVGKTLAVLWDIEEEVKDIDEKTDKWNKIRDTCDAYDIEMKKIMSKRK
jgi:DNA repair ATPase RecN